MTHSSGSAEASADRSSNDQVPDIPEGTLVVIGPEGTRKGKLVDGGLPQDEAYKVDFIDSKYGQAPVDRSMLAVPLASFDTWPTLDLPQGAEVLYLSADNRLGYVVRRSSGQAHNTILCRNRDGIEALYPIDLLALPLENWWPYIPLGTPIAYFPDSTSREEQYTAQEQPSANGVCTVVDEHGTRSTANLGNLVVPLNRWIHLDQVDAEREFEAGIDETKNEEMDAPAARARHDDMETLTQQLAKLWDENISLRDQVSSIAAESDAFKRKEEDTLAQLANLREENYSLHDQVSTRTEDIGTLTKREKEKDAQLASVQKESNNLQDQVRTLTSEINSSKRREKDKDAQLAIVRKENNSLHTQVRELTADNVASKRKEKKMGAELVNLRNQKTVEHKELRNQIASLQSQVSKQNATIVASKRMEKETTEALAALTEETRIMAAKVKMLEDQNNLLEDKSLRLNAAIQGLKEEERNTAAAMTELKNQKMSTAVELEKARERVRKLQGERLILGATGDHNYGSTFPSPSDLVAKIKTIEGQHITEWIVKALGEQVIPWPIGDEEISKGGGALRDFVLQLLVQTVLHCHQRVQDCVSSRKELMDNFVPAFLGGARGRLAKDFARFERSAFENGYKEIFSEICPKTPGDKTKLARDVFEGLPAYQSVLKAASPNGPNPNDLFDMTRESYEDIVTNLLTTFLECEIGKVTLKFSENFGYTQQWDPEEFQNETIDLSYEGAKPVLGHTWVQVVIPRIFWEKDDGTKRFETKASFVVWSA